MNKEKLYGILISYLIGVPTGFITVLIVLSIPTFITGEGLAIMAIWAVYGNAIIGLLIGFLVMLAIAGHYAFKDLQNGLSLIKTSFKYSLTINIAIWLIFILITLIDNKGKQMLFFLIPPILGFIISVIGATFSVGYLICIVINNKVERKNSAGNIM